MTNVEKSKAEKAAHLANGPSKDLEALRADARAAPLPFPLMALAYKRRKFLEAAFDDDVRTTHKSMAELMYPEAYQLNFSDPRDLSWDRGVGWVFTGAHARGGPRDGEARARAEGEPRRDAQGVHQAEGVAEQ
jgi:hypothetical protein